MIIRNKYEIEQIEKHEKHENNQTDETNIMKNKMKE